MASIPLLSFSTSNKRKSILICEGFIYQVNKVRPKVKYWRCKDRLCSAYMHTDESNQYIGKSGDHYSHLPIPETIEATLFKEKVKDRVVKETAPIGKIYESELGSAGLSASALALVALSDVAKSALNRLRRQTTPPLPNSSVFDVPDGYSVTTNGVPYLFSDTLVRKKRMILFSSEEQLRMLFSVSHIMIDGTFSSCVPHFDQVFSIHCIKHGYNFPCVIGLLPGRSVPVYEHVFNLLDAAAERLNLVFEPENVMSDFEKALIKTVVSHFPGTKHSGCYFHFTQCIYRHIQTLGLSTLYNENDKIRSLCRHLMALPLLPVEYVERAYYELNEQIPVELEPLFEYFDSWWMKQVPIKLWNVSDLKLRTNNKVESWHARFNKRIEKKHPNIWAFIDVLKNEEVHFRQQLIHANAGKLKKNSEKTCTMQSNLDELRNRYDNAKIQLSDYHYQLSLLVGMKKK